MKNRRSINYGPDCTIDEALDLIDEIRECEYTTIKRIELDSDFHYLNILVSIDTSFSDELDDDEIDYYCSIFKLDYDKMKELIINNIIWTITSSNIGYVTSITQYIILFNHREYWLEELLINEIYKQV